MRRYKLGLAVVSILFFLTSCATFEVYPSNNSDRQRSLAQHEPLFYEFLKAYENSEGDKRLIRNRLVRYRMADIDYQYRIFEKRIYVGSVRGQAYRDSRAGLVDGTSRFFGGITRLDALKTLSPFVRTIDNSGNELIPSAIRVIAQMKAGRKKIKQKLLWKFRKPADEYDIYAAWSDLNDYYNAGTIPSALIALNMPKDKEKVPSNSDISTNPPIETGDSNGAITAPTPSVSDDSSDTSNGNGSGFSTSSTTVNPSSDSPIRISKREFNKWAKQSNIYRKLLLWASEKNIDLYDLQNSDSSKYRKLRAKAYQKILGTNANNAPSDTPTTTEPVSNVSTEVNYLSHDMQRWYSRNKDNKQRLEAWAEDNGISVNDLIYGMSEGQIKKRQEAAQKLSIH